MILTTYRSRLFFLRPLIPNLAAADVMEGYQRNVCCAVDGCDSNLDMLVIDLYFSKSLVADNVHHKCIFVGGKHRAIDTLLTVDMKKTLEYSSLPRAISCTGCFSLIKKHSSAKYQAVDRMWTLKFCTVLIRVIAQLSNVE